MKQTAARIRLSFQERSNLKETFNRHGIRIVDLSRMTGRLASNITGWFGGYLSINQDVQQQLIEYAELLNQLDAGGGNEPEN